MKTKFLIFFILQLSLFSSGSMTSKTRLDQIKEKYKDTQIQILQNQISPAHSPVQISKMQINNATVEDFANLMQSVNSKADLIISTDSQSIVDEALSFDQDTKRSGISRLIPLGQLKDKYKDNKLTKFYQHLKTSAKNDKIGLTIAFLATATDCYVWFHATQFSPETRAAQMIFTTLSAILFSIDKDFWAHNARKIQGKILKVYDQGLNKIIEQNSLFYKLSSIYLANLAMGVAFQSTRLSLLSFDAVLTSKYVLTSLLTATVVSMAYTFATFAWSEFSANINEAKTPFAKFVARRWSETRSVLLAQAASSGKVLQPEVYGASPWIAMTVSGFVGVVALLKTDKIVNWLENSPMLTPARDLFHKKTQTALQPLSCAEIFM